MQEFIHLCKHPGVDMFNTDFLTGADDYKIEDLVIICMKELEAVSNITIESVETVYDMDEIDINEHNINWNQKKKDLSSIVIPKYKYMTEDLYAEMIFGIRIKTNLNERFIKKKILIPVIDDDNFYTIGNKKAKAIWQLLEASVYTQRGRITLKSRMPIIIYKSKVRTIVDVNGEVFPIRTFSYAMDTSRKKKKGNASAGKKNKNKFINPMMIYSAKVGVHKAIAYMGVHRAVQIVEESKPESNKWLYFPLDEVFVRVDKKTFEDVPMVASVVGMLVNLSNKDYPVTWDNLEDYDYWIARIGFIGAPKDKQLKSYYEKGKTAVLMIERLYDTMTKLNLRLPDSQKENIYSILRWMMYEYDDLRQKNNIDINTKRIRKAEYLVKSTLGRKISENINNKIIPRLSESRQNSMDTLLEIFNFPSMIIINGMKNLNDLVKSDELVNDMSILLDMAFSSKGPEALGEDSTKNIMLKMRDIHPSFLGVIDPNCSSNSDVGMSGAIVPTVKLYDRFFFCPEREPAHSMYETMSQINKDMAEDTVVIDGDEVVESIEVPSVETMTNEEFNERLKYFDDLVGIQMAPICIVERDPSKIEDSKKDKLVETPDSDFDSENEEGKTTP